MNDDTRDAGLMLAMEILQLQVERMHPEACDRLLPIVDAWLARARHEQERPEDRG